MEDRRTIPGAIVETVYLIGIIFLTYKQSLPPVWCGGLLAAYAIANGFVKINKQNARVVAGLTGVDVSSLASDGPTSSVSQRMRALRQPPSPPNDPPPPPPPPNPDHRTREMPATRGDRESRPHHDDPRRDPDWKPPRTYRHRLLAWSRRIQGWGRHAAPAVLLLLVVAHHRLGLPHLPLLPRS